MSGGTALIISGDVVAREVDVAVVVVVVVVVVVDILARGLGSFAELNIESVLKER
jgi:hypothetical protein